MTPREIVVKIFKFVLLNSVFAIIAIMVISLWFRPAPRETTRTVIVRDSAEIAQKNEQIKEMQGQIEKDGKKEISLVKRVLGLEKELQAANITIGNTDPLEPIIVERVVNDTVYSSLTYPYDLPYYGKITEDEIEFMTLNPYLESLGKDYVKRYRFDRLYDEFEFIVTTATNIETASLRIYASRPFVKFKGLYGGFGYDFNRAHIWLEARFIFYGVEIKPVLRSDPYLGVETGVRLW